jgi:hypothetical protein
MNRFVKTDSLLFHIAGWFFIATLFCDGANLDDLLSGSVVLHDDDEVIAADQSPYAGADIPVCRGDYSYAGASAVRQPVHLLRAPVRVIIDQDSPSLAAGRFQIGSATLPLLKDSPEANFECPLPPESLFIRFRSLLI